MSLAWRIFWVFWLVLASTAALGIALAWVKAHHSTVWIPVWLLAGVLCSAASWGAARHVGLPLLHVRAGLRALAVGDSSVRLDAATSLRPGAMGQAVIDFDTVAGRLQVRDEMQAAFIRDISHDLRSPLTRMRLALELARRQDATQPLQLDRMEHECERLDKLVAQLLWLALPCGSDQRSSVLVNLNDTVSQAVADAAFESQPKKLQILWERPARPVVVTGHSEQLNSLCENILRNALRYSPQGGAVSVALAARRGKAVLRFADRGPGVPAAAQAHLFEPFFRVDPSQAAGHASLGLGLALAGRVAFEHGGRIRAANRQGGGLRVFVELPLALMPHGASI